MMHSFIRSPTMTSVPLLMAGRPPEYNHCEANSIATICPRFSRAIIYLRRTSRSSLLSWSLVVLYDGNPWPENGAGPPLSTRWYLVVNRCGPFQLCNMLGDVRMFLCVRSIPCCKCALSKWCIERVRAGRMLYWFLRSRSTCHQRCWSDKS